MTIKQTNTYLPYDPQSTRGYTMKSQPCPGCGSRNCDGGCQPQSPSGNPQQAMTPTSGQPML